jgi:hypothetical protein
MSRSGDLIEAVHDHLDKIADRVLRYKPAPKSKAAKRRAKRKRNRDRQKG